ncbi:deoxynucleotidyltransferase terminal-interacting protein 2-like [Culex pipiens pallens]|uniref:deoxynucleotidyltransferase terminal-interacting protein 2-like n=1 Tax=Culex pipiens pallens TaxID=42434 RepID=UPI00195332ED|nr:deoxynucleotidyltransferase terminal-interacting protein 2-like [Culex pipiens pallens]
MDLFTIDTAGAGSADCSETFRPVLLPSSSNYQQKPTSQEDSDEDEEDDDDYGGLPPPSKDIFEILGTSLAATPSSSKAKRGTELLFREDLNASKESTLLRKARYNSRVETASVKELALTDVAAHMKAAVVTPATEKQKNLATLSMTDRQLKEQSRKERAKTKGGNWFNLGAPELTEETKNELELIRMRSALDPKRFYKRSEMKTLPKYFQIGKVIDSPLDFYNERGTKKTKAKTLVDELLEDAEFQRYNKRKYAEALEKRKKKAYVKATMKMKKLKKKKK